MGWEAYIKVMSIQRIIHYTDNEVIEEIRTRNLVEQAHHCCSVLRRTVAANESWDGELTGPDTHTVGRVGVGRLRLYISQ